MERSAINSYTAAGAFIGLTFGLYVAWSLVGLRDPGILFAAAGAIATIVTAITHWLIARRFKRAAHRGQMALAISGWFVLVGSVVALIVATDHIFPKAVAG